MNLMQLYYFKTLAKKEHYTHAAEELEISQSALSQSIAQLEAELKTFLFIKQGRNIVLTKNGRIFLSYVEKALNELEIGVNALQKLNSLEMGKISIGIISGVGHHIPQLMSHFMKIPKYAGITFSCAEGTTDELLKKLKDEQFDLVLCSIRENESSIDFVPIIEGRLVVLVPQKHPLSCKQELLFKDIAPYPVIAHTTDCGMRTLTESLFSKAGLKPQIVMEAQDDVLIAKLVESNHGIALITDIPEIRKFNINIIPLTEPYAKRFIYLASMKNRNLSPAALAFKIFLLKRRMITPADSQFET